MKVYFFDKFNKSMAKGERENRDLLLKSLNDFISMNKGQEKSKITIEDISVSDKGKPYVSTKNNLCFSISHSENIWICAVDEAPVGIDIENLFSRSYLSCHKISERYFSDKEKSIVNKEKTIGFFKIWTAKEAITKLFNESIWDNISSLEVDINNKLCGGRYRIESFKFGEEFLFTIASHGVIPEYIEPVNLEKIYE